MKKILPSFANNNNITDFENRTINGTSIDVLESRNALEFKMPKGVRGWCHSCNKGFKSIDDLNNHVRDGHRIFKG